MQDGCECTFPGYAIHVYLHVHLHVLLRRLSINQRRYYVNQLVAGGLCIGLPNTPFENSNHILTGIGLQRVELRTLL